MALSDPVGTWQDDKGTEYKVSRDGPARWTVETCRPNGHRRITKGLLKLWEGAVYWGSSYYLEDCHKQWLTWKPLKEGKAEYHWYAAEEKKREKHFVVKEPRDKDADSPKDRGVTPKPTKDMASQTESPRPAVEMIVRITGKWKDESGSHYEVVPDSDSTCTVVTTRPTGRVLRTEGLLKYNPEECCIYWGSKFRLELKDSQSCVWVPLRSGKSFCWQADSPRPVVMHTSTLPTARNIVEASAQLQDLLGISKPSGNSRGAPQKRIYNRPLISRNSTYSS